jgi:chloramphenicol-sensitive protein RarD
MKNKGVILAGGAYVLWGLLPVYWKQLHTVPALQTLSHRIVWALVFTVILLTARRDWAWLKPALHSRKTVLIFLASAAFLSVNWLVYIWAVNTNYVVEASLGYFMTPLLNVALGVLLYKERMRMGQWLAIALAAAGVLYLAIVYGHFPWIGLTLAVSFAVYGVLRKQAPLPSLQGLTLETMFAAVPALLFLTTMQASGQAAFINDGALITALLIGAGAITAVPLLMFAAGVRLIPLTTLGILQFISPTIQFLLGVLVYNEPFNLQRLLGFSLVWLALIVFTAENLITRRRAMHDTQVAPA